jgi:hypothetical protein
MAVGSVVGASAGFARHLRYWKTGPKSLLSCSDLAFFFSFRLAFCFAVCNLLDFELGGLFFREILVLGECGVDPPVREHWKIDSNFRKVVQAYVKNPMLVAVGWWTNRVAMALLGWVDGDVLK